MSFSSPRMYLTLLILIFLSKSEASYIKEKRKIMAKYREAAAAYLYQSGLFSHPMNELPIKETLSLDPLTMFQEMREETDGCFLITFWSSFDSLTVFFSPKYYKSQNQQEFKQEIAMSKLSGDVAFFMIYHFKVYLMENFLSFSGDKWTWLNEARSFYFLKLKKLILEIRKGKANRLLLAQLKQIEQVFYFYYKCIDEKNLKSIIISEFYRLKSALDFKNTKQIDIHSENIALLAGSLLGDASNIFGFRLVFDQSPILIGYFLLLQSKRYFLLRDIISIKNVNWKQERADLISHLYTKIPILDISKYERRKLNSGLTRYSSRSKDSLIEFKLLDNFTNPLEGKIDTIELIEVTRAIFYKILSL
jgi:hypothetical protein